MTSLTLLLCGLLAAMTFTSGVSSSDVTSEQLRHIRSSLSRHMRALQAEAAEKRRRFVGQLATDCGMDCKREQEAGAQAKRVLGSELEALRKRFMSLGAADCGSYECVQKKRNAQEEIKRLLTGEGQQRASVVGARSTRRRHKRFLDVILGSDPYNQPSPPHDNNYGSYGWGDDYNGSDNDYNDDYYDYDYDYSGDYYDYSGGSSDDAGYNDME